MALASVGLSTHIFNNNFKSTLLLLGFPVLLLFLIWLFFTSLSFFGYSASLGYGTVAYGQSIAPLDAMKMGVDGAIDYGIWAIAFALVWFVVAYFFHARMIRMATGAKSVTRKELPKIYNMLENLCISRGMKMPGFQIIETDALNAFASGINEKTFCITLTRGIIDRLDDDELEGVIAHELTHIINRDVRLLIISVIFVGMISFFAQLGFRMLIHGGGRRRHRSSGNSKNNTMVIMVIAVVILAVGYVLAIGIRFALSRKREFLADAGAVELTKNPEAMMRALLRISGNDEIDDMPSEVQQMCIENSHNFMGMFATHPPIDKRVKILSEMTDTPIPALSKREEKIDDTAVENNASSSKPTKIGPWS